MAVIGDPLSPLVLAPLLTPLLSFMEPVRLWWLLLIPALVGFYLFLVNRKRKRNARIARTMFDLVIPRDRTWLRHLAVGLSILSLLTLTLAFAKPKDQVSVPRERATVVITIDVSLSMEAEDVEPNRLEAAKTAGTRKVVFASSGGTVYGQSDTLPVPEAAPLRPVAPYGAAKVAGECYVDTYQRLYGLQGTSLALGNVYGPRQDPHGEAGVVSIFARALATSILRMVPRDGFVMAVHGPWGSGKTSAVNMAVDALEQIRVGVEERVVVVEHARVRHAERVTLSRLARARRKRIEVRTNCTRRRSEPRSSGHERSSVSQAAIPSPR